jgi:type IV pilus assembly protein PilA
MRKFVAIQGGFTLIELMIVVAIIGILAAVAIPQYQDYTVKAKLGNALTAVDSLKTSVGLCAQENGTLGACDAGANGVPANAAFTATKEVASVTVVDGVITMTLAAANMGTGVDGKKISYTPSSGSTSLTWCVASNITNAAGLSAVVKNSVGTCTAPT